MSTNSCIQSQLPYHFNPNVRDMNAPISWTNLSEVATTLPSHEMEVKAKDNTKLRHQVIKKRSNKYICNLVYSTNACISNSHNNQYYQEAIHTHSVIRMCLYKNICGQILFCECISHLCIRIQAKIIIRSSIFKCLLSPKNNTVILLWHGKDQTNKKFSI